MFKTTTLRLPLILFILSLFISTEVFAQTGKIVGRITDKELAEELIGASVAVVGTSTGALTDLDGNFSISLKPGTYSLRISYIGYQSKTIKGIEVKVGEASRQDVEMTSEGIQAQEIVVEAELNTATEGALLTERRKSLSVSDGISAEFIKKTPDSDAGDAIKRTTGVSVMDGKYVFVRGLGERYSNTQLNGVNIPSPEPEKKVVPFDIIPANLIDNIVTVKTFLPDQPGTFAGGLVRIKTKEFPDEFQARIGISGGLNSNVHFNNISTYDGGSLDFLGIDDGTRELPSSVGDLTRGSVFGSTRAAELAKFDNNIFLPSSGKYSPNQSYSVAIADQINFNDLPIGYIANLTYSKSSSYKEQDSFFPSSEANSFRYDWGSAIAKYDVNWGGVLNFTTKLNNDNKVGIKTTYNRTSEDEVTVAQGFQKQPDPSQLLRSTRLRFVERQMWSSQLSGNHYLSGFAKSEFEWKVQYASAKRYEPDNRETFYVYDEDKEFFTFDDRSKRNFRFFSELDDNEYDVIGDLTVPFKQWNGYKSRLKIGGLFTSKSRDFVARRFAYIARNVTAIEGLAPNELFVPENVESGIMGFEETTSPTDDYTADEKILAGYALVELPLIRNLRFIGGARVENNDIVVNSMKIGDVPVSGGFDETNILPSLNMIYELNEQMNIRGSFSQTIANPELRELAPFQFDNYRTATVGNPYLKQTKILNYDLRWEWFPKFGELVAISLFYKDLDKPLEAIIIDGVGTKPLSTTVNGNSAVNYGMELEIRKNLGFVTSTLDNFNFTFNLTLVNSEISQGGQATILDPNTSEPLVLILPSLSGKRKLQGQSPYVVNFNLAYNNPESGLSGMLLYNIVGERIYEISGNQNLLNNFLEQPRHQLDLSLGKTISDKIKAKLNVKNILNDRYLIMFGDDEAEQYKIGTSYSLSLSYAL